MRPIQELELDLPPLLPNVALANELQARRKDVEMLRKDLELLHARWREGEAEDEEANEIGADITRLSALKGQHERRIREIEQSAGGASLTNDELITGAIQWLWDHRVHSQVAILHIMMAAVHPRKPISLTDGLRAWKRHALQVDWIDGAIREAEGPGTPHDVSNVMFLNAVHYIRHENRMLPRTYNFIESLVHPDEVKLASQRMNMLLFASAEQVGRSSQLLFEGDEIIGFDPTSCRENERYTFCPAIFIYNPLSLSVAFANDEHMQLLRQLREKLQRGWHIVGLPLEQTSHPGHWFDLERTANLIEEARDLSISPSRPLLEFISVVIASLAGLNVVTLKEAFLNPNNKDNVLRLSEQGIDRATIDSIVDVADDYDQAPNAVPLDLETALSRPAIAYEPRSIAPPLSHPPVVFKQQSPIKPKAQAILKPKSRSRSPTTTQPKARSRSPRQDESDEER